MLQTLLQRGWNIVAGGVTVLLLPLFLSATEQGYYYTFASVLALQVFFELGLGQVILQLVSHEAAQLVTTADGRLTGPAPAIARLASLARLIRRWYLVAAVLFAMLCGTAGALFFTKSGHPPAPSWLGAWLLLIGLTSVNLWLSPALAVHEACGRVGQVARLRLWQAMVTSALLWGALAAGAGLWVTALPPLVGALSTAFWLRVRGHPLRWLARLPPDHATQPLRWRHDILPLQWRIAVSWVSGYFIFNLFTPVVFAHDGPREAGRLGMALSLFSAVSLIGMSWITAKAPTFTMLIARGERSALNALFRQVAARSVSATVVLSLGVAAAGMLLQWWQFPLSERLPDPAVLACLALATSVNGFVSAAAVFMRAHREEPMLAISVVVAALAAALVHFGAGHGVLVMMSLYAALTVMVSLPWTSWLLRSYLRRT